MREDVAKKEGTAQQQSGKCMVCDLLVSSTGAFNFHSLIINCVLMPAAVNKGFKALRYTTESKRAGKREVALVVEIPPRRTEY